MTDFRKSVTLHHSTHNEDTASLTFIQQNPPTYNLLPGPADSSFPLFEALAPLTVYQAFHPQSNLLILLYNRGQTFSVNTQKINTFYTAGNVASDASTQPCRFSTEAATECVTHGHGCVPIKFY